MSDKGIDKKLRKRVKAGSINTLKLYQDCLSSNLRGVCSLDVKVDTSRLNSKPRFDFHSAELKGWLMAYLYDKEVIPRPFSMGNRYFCRNIVILHYTDFDLDLGNHGNNGSGEALNGALTQALLSSQSVFDEKSADAPTSEPTIESKMNVETSFKTMWNSLSPSVAAEPSSTGKSTHTAKQYMKVSTAYLMKISKQANEVVPLPLKMFLMSAQDTEEITSNDKNGSSSTNSSNGKNGKKQDSDIQENGASMTGDAVPAFAIVTNTAEYAKYVIATSLLKMWGYPLPTDSPIIDSNNPAVDETGKELQDNKRSREEQTDGNHKKQKVEESTSLTTTDLSLVGNYSHIIPSPQDIQGILNNGHEWFATNVTVDTKTQLSHYHSTMSRTSAQYQSLFVEEKGAAAEVPVDVCAIDCEMCLTAKGSALTRLSITAVDGSTILDSYILPDEPIVDYVTKYSGITEELLQTQPTLSQKQAQLTFLRIVSAETILCGHSLDNDLKALQVCHMRCIDSCIVYPHSRGFPFRMKLKDLTKRILNVSIQSTGNDEKKGTGASVESNDKQEPDTVEEGEKEGVEQEGAGSIEASIGHCSVVDAQMAMRLVQAKVKGGVLFGLPRKSFLHNQMKNVYGGKSAMSLFQPLSLMSYTSKVEDDRKGGLSSHGFFWDANVWDDEHYTQSYSQVFGGGDSYVYISKRDGENEREGQSAEDTLLERSKDIVDKALHFLTPTVSSTGPSVPPVRFAYIGLRHHSVAQTKLTIEGIQTALTNGLGPGQEGSSTSGGGKGGSILLVCAQKSLQALTQMRKMKFLVNTQNTTLPWDQKKEEMLKAACSEANIASVAWSCHG